MVTKPDAVRRKLVDRDGDEWVEREDGWCCQSPCEHDGVLVHHECSEHEHWTLAEIERDFGPLAEVKP